MFACLMILFEARSIKYAEIFSIQCLIIILVIFTVENDKVLHWFILTYLTSSFEFGVDEAFDKKRNHDMRGIKKTQKLKLGDSQGTPR